MKIVFFDGYCSLCNALIDWLMKMDKRNRLKFASLQGQTASRILKENSYKNQIDPETVSYFDDGKIYERSTAILMIFSELGGAWLLTKLFFIFPGSLRDLFYKFVARNRYRFFGKMQTCRIPTDTEKEKLLN
jgi:predicted DCC family thiol-disulfide oxidoreductase YuxK